MYAEAERVREAWKLRRVPRLSITNVTWGAIPWDSGVKGAITVHGPGTSFEFGFTYGVFVDYYDNLHQTHRFEYNEEQSLRLSKIKSRLTAEKAERLARSCLEALEKLDGTNFELIEPPEVDQFKFGPREGGVLNLPVFRVEWREPGWGPKYATNKDGLAFSQPAPGAQFDISGVTGEIGECHIWPASTFEPG